MPPLARKDDEIARLVQEGIAAELANREKADKLKKDPETMAELIDRISDATVEKVFARLDSEGGTGTGGEAPPKAGDGGEAPPGVEHPFFKPLFGKRAS